MSGKKYPIKSIVEIISILWERTEFKNGCWLYIGTLDNGYGLLYVNSITMYVHRISVETFYNVVLDYQKNGLQALHKRECINRNCWNPDHLYPGTDKENIIDTVILKTHGESKRTHCKNGHPFDTTKQSLGRTKRICSICRRVSTNKANKIYKARIRKSGH